MTAVTVRTVLDAPMLPLFDEDEARWEQIKAEHARLMALPGVVAVLDALPTLTAGQRDRLSKLWVANFEVHRLDQLRIGHRISRHDRAKAMRLRAVEDAVWSAAAHGHGRPWSGAHAAADAVYAAACGDLLTADEAPLFTKPWTGVLDSPHS